MTIDQFNFAGKKAFVRVDFNVPLDENFNITDDTRMRAALPTLKKILADGGSIIIGSHLGRPKGVADKFSLKHIIKHLSELLGVEVLFANDCMGEEAATKSAALKPGEVLLLENLRFYAEEEGKPRGLAEDASDEEKKAAKAQVKESQKEFTKKLASYADCYVNDAFGTAHRAHASTALIAKYFDKDNKMFGYKIYGSPQSLANAYRKCYERTIIPQIKKGLSATVYTQLTDVEDELNGILTYDRKVQKIPVSLLKAINERVHL